MKYIYLDNAATTQVDPRVRDHMLDFLGDRFGNPSSTHIMGQEAASVIEQAGVHVAGAVGNGPWKVFFTSGGTEADNLAVFSAASGGRRKKVIISAIEHPAVNAAAGELAARGLEVVLIDAPDGVVDCDAVASHADENTALVALIHVQNEIGTIQPVACVSQHVREKAPKAHFHLDSVQALGQIHDLAIPYEVDSVAVSSHKIHGPKGVGALLVRPGVTLHPMLFGGDQQERIRPGTQNVPGIAGFGKACELLIEERKSSSERMTRLSSVLKMNLVSSVEDILILGSEQTMSPATFSVGVRNVVSEVLLRVLQTKGVIASAGSACHAGGDKPSEALRKAGLPRGWGAVRLSLSRFSTDSDVDAAVNALAESITEIRQGRVSG